MSGTRLEQADADAAALADGVHRWNFWTTAVEAAIFISAVQVMGPMTLIPFLFRRVGIHESWLGLFQISMLLVAVGGPIGSAWAGGRRRKLLFCLKMGTWQRLAFVLLPLGCTFFYERPALLLMMVSGAWVLSFLCCGVAMPAYQAVVAGGVKESWWGRRMSVQNALSAAGALAGSGAVWWINQRFDAPWNYIYLGWFGVAMLFVSLYIVSLIREVPLPAGRDYGAEPVGRTLRRMGRILREDGRVRWVMAARAFRTFGFYIGTYMAAMFIERCRLRDEQMWIPVVLATVPQIPNHLAAGWFVDRFGAQRSQTVSAVLVAVNALFIMQCHTVAHFALLYTATGFGGSLMMNSWNPLLMKLAAPEHRPAYFATVNLGAAPGAVLVAVLGMALVRFTGFDVLFYLTCAGGFAAAALFWWKVPHVDQAPGCGAPEKAL